MVTDIMRDSVVYLDINYALSKLLLKHFLQLFNALHPDRAELSSARVLQGTVLDIVLYVLCACYIPELKHDAIVIFADDTAIMTIIHIKRQ